MRWDVSCLRSVTGSKKLGRDGKWKGPNCNYGRGDRSTGLANLQQARGDIRRNAEGGGVLSKISAEAATPTPPQSCRLAIAISARPHQAAFCSSRSRRYPYPSRIDLNVLTCESLSPEPVSPPWPNAISLSFQTKIADLVQIAPEDFSKQSAVAIEDNINAKYSNKVLFYKLRAFCMGCKSFSHVWCPRLYRISVYVSVSMTSSSPPRV